MAVSEKILEELKRYNKINNYIFEQDATLTPPAPEGDIPPAPDAGLTPPATDAAAPTDTAPEPQPIDVASDPDVEKIDDKGKKEDDKSGDETEELDVTELVDTQKNIQTKQDEYFENLFSQISNLEQRLGEMDQIMSKLNSLESKIDKYRTKSPEEKLNLRVFDSYPYNQRLTDFFDDKKEEMEKTGKNEYVLTDDEVSDINVNDVKNSFQPSGQDREDFKFR